jgi:hypothetical protein
MLSYSEKIAYGALCRSTIGLYHNHSGYATFFLPAAASAAQEARIHSEPPQMQISNGNQKQRASARRAESRVNIEQGGFAARGC